MFGNAKICAFLGDFDCGTELNVECGRRLKGLGQLLWQARQCLLQAKIANIYTNIVKTDNKSGIIQDDERQR